MGYPPYIQASGERPAEENWRTMPDELKQEILALMRVDASREGSRATGELDGPCVWLDLDSMQCRHHQHRPRVCRDFSVGSRGCQEWREAYRDEFADQTE